MTCPTLFRQPKAYATAQYSVLLITLLISSSVDEKKRKKNRTKSLMDLAVHIEC